MFTGIVSGLGRVVRWDRGCLTVSHEETARAVQVGGSVAVNGVCLTVTGVQDGGFLADVVPETLRRTNLGGLRDGDPVNLELPLTLARGLDGHLVQGHVDGTAAVRRVRAERLGREVEIELPPELAPFVAEKGSIAVDGASLTVAGLTEGGFRIALIPHTLERTVAAGYEPGRLVNLEVDVVARYVHRLLGWPAASHAGRAGKEAG